MATCPKCEHVHFIAKEITIQGLEWRHKAIVCASCDTVIAIEPYEETNYLLYCLAKALKVNLDKIHP